MDSGKEQLLVRSTTVVARVIGGETLIVPVRGKVGDLASIYSLNETGSLIWKLLESPKKLSQLIAAVADEFDVDPNLAGQDVQAFVRDMEGAGLVEAPMSMAISEERPVDRNEPVLRVRVNLL